MIRFNAFESIGVAVAAVSDKSDGDCGSGGTDGAGGGGARAALCRRCDVDPGRLVTVRQVHGTRVVVVADTRRGEGDVPPDDTADGIVTAAPGLPVAVFVADCVPVYLQVPGRGVGGIVHAGRRGVLGNIVGEAVQVLVRDFAVDPGAIHALIGPSAGPCCYEVSPALAEAFVRAGLPAEGRHLDLWEANACQLVAAGVPREHVAITAICTICDGRFHSYRADGGHGRNMALLAL